MKRVFVVPGFKATPRSSWFPSLAARLRSKGVEVQVLAMPNPWTPLFGPWTRTIAKAVGNADEQTFFVGHSTGAVAILRYLETLPAGARVGGAVLVSGFPQALFAERLPHLLTRQPRPNKIKNKVARILAVHSDDDWRVPLSNASWLERELGAEIVVMKGAGHITGKSGYFDLPEELLMRIEAVLGL